MADNEDNIKNGDELEYDLLLLHQIPQSIVSTFQSIEYDRSGYFWNICALGWHEDFVHKVYVLVETNSVRILGYFSIQAHQIKLNISEAEIQEFQLTNIDKKQEFPIVDIPFLGISNSLDIETQASVLGAILEHIEDISLEVSTNIATRFIRNYIPYQKINANENDQVGPPISEFYIRVFEEAKYIISPVSEKKGRRFVNERGGIPIAMKYFIRDLKR